MALPLPIPIIEPPPVLVPGMMPVRGAPTDIPGAGAMPEWNDVWQWEKEDWDRFWETRRAAPEPVTHDEVDNAITAAMGTVTKALSGFVNTATDLATEGIEWTNRATHALAQSMSYIWSSLDGRLARVEAIQQAILDLAIPNLDARLRDLRHDMNLGFQYNSAMDRGWVEDNLFRPLQENLGQVAAAIPVWAGGAYERAKDYTDVRVDQLGVNTLTHLVPLTLAVGALEQFKDECAQPMCETMGPKTDLGKVLRALNAAEWLALLAALAALDKGGVEALLRAMQSASQGIFEEFGDLFVGGHGTVGGALTGAG